jgi:hypothetical protein
VVMLFERLLEASADLDIVINNIMDQVLLFKHTFNG